MTNPTDKVLVKHIGKHAKRADTMSGEGTVWHGEGDVQPVSRRAWENHLKKHPDLWVLVDGEATAPAASSASAAQAEAQRVENERVAAELAEQKRQLDEQAATLAQRERAVEERERAAAGTPPGAGLESATGNGAATDYESMGRNALAKLAGERKLEVDGRSDKPTLIAALKAADAPKF